MAPNVGNLLDYLAERRFKTVSLVLTDSVEAAEEVDGSLIPWQGEDLPWNGRSCLVVLLYVMKFLSSTSDHHHGLLNDIIRHLEEFALHRHYPPWVRTDNSSEGSTSEDKPLNMKQLIAGIFVNSFMPEVQKFFKVPKLHELSENDKSLKENEILAGFMDFLLQILDSEALVNSDEEQKYALLRKELTFFLTFLGDIPFQCTELEQVKNLLAEFETLANEVADFIYSYVFSTRPVETNRFGKLSLSQKTGLIKKSIVKLSELVMRGITPRIGEIKNILADVFATRLVNATRFYRKRNSLLEKVGILNEKIKEHCVNFSELPSCIISPKANAIDSLFIVDSLLEDVENVINGRFDLPIDDIKDQLKTIHEEMTIARTILKDSEVVQDTYQDKLKESLIQISNVAYEAEYLINAYVAGNVPIWYLNLRLPNVSRKIKLIGIRLQEIMNIYDMKALEVVKDFTMKLSFKPIETHIDNILVGFEDERTKILGDLTGGSKGRQIISIFGLPGLGKTTIAKKLYNDRVSLDYFDERAWSVVSQTYHKKNVLISILMSLAANKSEMKTKEIMEMEEESLGLEIHKWLKGQRYLIVMDDVWDSSIWYELRRYFPDDVNGSRIILTSRVRDTAPTGSIFHPLPLLSEVQCWDLLEKKVFPCEPCPSQLLCIGKEIAAKCHGLPLVVVVVAGFLAKLDKEEYVWKGVERNLDSYIFDNPSGCLKILELSYNYLPNHLKRCFLYFGAFPEDTEIPTRKLTWLWMAEGFIPKQEENSPENVAEQYLSDLINRSLVMAVKRRSTGGIKTCIIHDLLHDMCLRKAHDENFLKSIKEELSVYDKHQRLFVHSTPRCLRHFGLHCRSFLGSLSDPSPGFSRMPLLRVMDMLPMEIFYSDMEEIFRLVNLRYLSIPELPHPTVNHFLNLEILCFEFDQVLKLSFVLKMVKLRHLHQKSKIQFEKDCDAYEATNMKSLSDLLVSKHEDEEVLRHSPYLLKLKCTCVGTLFPDLRSLSQLETLSIAFSENFKCELAEILFPSTIKKLTLSSLPLPWEVMSRIGRLRNLQYLKLCYGAFMREEWVTKDGEFQELRFLILESSSLKQWITCSEHFPKLECLKLNDCPKLEETPSDLGNISTLLKVEVNFSSYEASISAVRIEMEQHEYGNEEFQVVINNSYWSKEKLVQECTETSDKETEEN